VLSARAAFHFVRHDGYLTDGYDDQNDRSARLSALWTPAPNLSLLVVGEYVRAQGQGSGAAFRSTRQAQPSNPWTGPSEAPPPQASILGPDDILTNGFVNTRIYAVSAELNWDLGPATITFIPAYRNTRPDTLTYQAGFYFNARETAEQQSYELRIHDEGLRLKWVAGAYYFDEDQTQEYEARARPIQLSHVATQLATKSYALFGDATYSLTSDWRLLGGVRFSHDRKSQDGLSVLTLPIATTVNNFGRRRDSNVSFRAGTEYDVSPLSIVFGTVATGYKAGGFFPSVPYPANSYKPETITAYTLGARSRMFDDRVQLSFETFYWRYRNKQERFLGVLASGGVNLLTTNAGAATLYGSNLGLTARIAGGELKASVEYLHTRYSSFGYDVANAGPFAPLGYSTLATTCALGAIHVIARTLTTQHVDCSGKPLPHAPEWSGSASYERDFTLRNGDRVTPQIDVRYASQMFLSADFIRSGSDDGYVTLDASLGYAHRGVTFTAWVRNLTNQAIYSGGFRYPFSFHEPFGDPTVFYADIRPPRRFGVTLTAATDWLRRR
jgi:iron complex outermembrane receptor protein